MHERYEIIFHRIPDTELMPFILIGSHYSKVFKPIERKSHLGLSTTCAGNARLLYDVICCYRNYSWCSHSKLSSYGPDTLIQNLKPKVSWALVRFRCWSTPTPVPSPTSKTYIFHPEHKCICNENPSKQLETKGNLCKVTIKHYLSLTHGVSPASFWLE